MYRKILVTLENSRADESLLPHVAELARLLKSELLLLHVADGFAAQHFDTLTLAESEEMRGDREYLEESAAKLRAQGLEVTTQLALGDPPAEILRTAEREGCDLIAMASHGHRGIADLIHGSTIAQVRHKARVPLLVVRAERKGRRRPAGETT
ncbi:MAG: universal stress protein [Planctomycetota bacterium]|nr:universal stress protein [Planctomycetota bacterium]